MQEALEIFSPSLSSLFIQGDFFALELVGGHLYLHLGLGSEPLKFRASRHSNHLANGEWHKVTRAH